MNTEPDIQLTSSALKSLMSNDIERSARQALNSGTKSPGMRFVSCFTCISTYTCNGHATRRLKRVIPRQDGDATRCDAMRLKTDA